jgi:hypothetical protein
MSTEHWWDNNWQRKTEVLREEDFSQWYFVQYKSHMDNPAIDIGN